jgi:hypothetical protein
VTDRIGSWEEDRERKYLVGLEVSVDERLAWLEEVLELAHAAGALGKPRDAWGRPLDLPSGRGVGPNGPLSDPRG